MTKQDKKSIYIVTLVIIVLGIIVSAITGSWIILFDCIIASMMAFMLTVVKFGGWETERKIYHGGCHGCVEDQKFCKGCQYYKADWSLPNLYRTPYHGGCGMCKYIENQKKCNECCYKEANWSLPDQNSYKLKN